jgi:hypothetical protein
MSSARCIMASVLAVSVLASPVQAASGPAGALTPGKPAGVREAQLDRSTVAVVGAAILLIGGFSVLIAGAQNDNVADTTIAGGSPSTGVGTNKAATTTTTGTH